MIKRIRKAARPTAFARLSLFWLLACVAGAALLLANGLTSPPEPMGNQAATQALSPSSYHTKNIEDVKAGEHVWAYDTVNRHWSAKEVIKSLVHDYQGDLVTVTVEGRSVASTGNHPFWVVAGERLEQRREARDVPVLDQHRPGAAGKWIAARDLEAGDVLVLRDGRAAPIEMVTVRQAPMMKVYNLQVADLHTYAVGDLGIAVHNKPCFPPGTLVLMGDRSTKPIEQVRVGDYVLSRDPTSDSPARPCQVTCLIRDFADGLVHVTFCSPDGSKGTVTSTRFHPFWTQNRGWREAEDVRTGDILEAADGQGLRVSRTESETPLSRSYNLSVEDFHTYFVISGAESILVHNQEAPPIPPIVYRSGGSNPSSLTPRPGDNGLLSTRDSISNPWPQPDSGPVMRNGQPIQAIDTSQLPPGSVVPDGAPYGTQPPGHVSIGPDVDPQIIKSAIVDKIKPVS